MNFQQFSNSLADEAPGGNLSPALTAMWWDAKGDWVKAHALVDESSNKTEMAVHAYLHRKEGSAWNADYWYQRSGTEYRRAELEEEWAALVEMLVSQTETSSS